MTHAGEGQAGEGHVCDPRVCGLAYDPACPVWGGCGSLPWGPVTFSELLATLRSPHYGPQLRAVLLELLAPDIGRIVAELLADRGGRR